MNNKSKIEFEVKPLDINLAKIEMQLIDKLKNIDENESIKITKNYKNPDTSLDLDEIIVKCEHIKNIILSVEFKFKNTNSKNILFFDGSKKNFLEYLYKKNFFITCKKEALKLNED